MNRRNFLKWSGLAALAALAGGVTARSAMAGNKYYSGPVSDHFDGKLFFNPNGEEPSGFLNLIRWKLGNGNKAWPESFPSPFPQAVPEERVSGDRLVATMVGHASFLIQVAGLNILTDPVWDERASPVRFAGPKRVNQPGINMGDLPPIDLVIVTHNHYDHMDLETLWVLQGRDKPHFVTPLGNDDIIRDRVTDARIDVMDWGGRLDLGRGITLHCEPCHHWSARGLGDRRMALWAAFVIETPAGKIYHIGDTGFHSGINYRAAREKHGGFRLANLPFGAYEPQWFMKAQHQNPDEAVEGMLLCNAAHVAGHHWGTFKLTDEGIEEPVEALHAALDKRSLPRDRFRPMRPGEVFEVPAATA
ncbi:L-ascorbate metabolism protein UlaG (beta-lactamase superfamily) [Pseudorhizobium tarimense]|uniref:L-ascorbate metabolism protein UlaG (Beta-lactamase superfamily) n=1 Tax=Pseudorhizobium tarimense TaxID=1079109 RepID=A0ABV2H8W7_9HYPH|nr:MBL fold metallo-hydrolase [Pseudorhizobium tarimense]MCJ8519948.1 MBL fold metallo-hydrolase [Pseudorhizobium tarimense]